MDPAVYGLLGTGVGGFIGFVGTWFSTRTTARATAEREERARLFTEKKKSYANAADVLSTVINELFGVGNLDDFDSFDFAEFDSKWQHNRSRYYAAYYDLLIICGDPIIEDSLRKLNHYWVECTRFPSRLVQLDHEKANNSGYLQTFQQDKRELRLAVSRLVIAMREDLRPTATPQRKRFRGLLWRRISKEQGVRD
jgi:hypothetical protein